MSADTKMKHEIKPESISEQATPVPYMPRVHLEISKEQLEVMEVGEDVTITLKGKVHSVSSNEMDEGSDKGRYEICLKMQEVIIDPKENEFEALLDEDDK